MGGKYVKGGGRPENSGRVKGTPNLKTRAIAQKCAAAGATPLEVIISLMNKAYAAGESCADDETRWKRYDDCARWAAMACPYMHSKMPTQVVHGGETKIDITWKPIRDN
jgi:hypothetical protein